MPKFLRSCDDPDLHTGWLIIRKPRLLRPPKKRFFRLTASSLSYYKQPRDVAARGWTLVSQIASVAVRQKPALAEDATGKYCICLDVAEGAKGKQTQWLLQPCGTHNIDEWLAALRTVGLCPSGTEVEAPQARDVGGLSGERTFVVHLPDTSGMVVFHIDPFLVSVHELKSAAVLAVERFLAAHAAAKRGTVAPAPAAPPASVALALAQQVREADQTEHGGVGVPDSAGHGSSGLSTGPGSTLQHTTAVDDAGCPGDIADTSKPSRAAGDGAASDAAATTRAVGFMDAASTEIVHGDATDAPAVLPRPSRVSLVGALVALPPRVRTHASDDDDDDMGNDEKEACNQGSSPACAGSPVPMRGGRGCGAGAGAAGAGHGVYQDGSSESDGEPTFLTMRDVLRGHPEVPRPVHASNELGSASSSSPRRVAGNHGFMDNTPTQPVVIVPHGRRAMQLFMNTPPGPVGLLGSSVEDSDASDHDQFDISARSILHDTVSEPVLRDTNLHVEVVSISNVDAPGGRPLSMRQPRRGASTPGLASTPRAEVESVDGAGSSQTKPVPAVRFTWPSSLPQPLCVKARRDNQHKHLACMQSVVTLGEDRAMFKAVAGDFSLENEDVTVDRYALKPNPSGVIDLRLVSKGTAALLQAFIPTTAAATDVVTGKTFIQYCITVRFDRTEWSIRRRYADFKRLHEQLCKVAGSKTLPRLPKKHIFTTNSKGAKFVSHRRGKLEQYLQAILTHPVCDQSVDVLAWLGGVSTMRNEAEEKKHRGVIHLSKVLEFVRTGDLVLFRCRNMLSGLQRKVTRSEFDHVGVVVSHRDRLHLLEATGDGVTLNPIRARLKSYGTEYTEGIAIRRLITDRTPDMEAGMRRFVSSVEGKPYKLTPAKLFLRPGIGRRHDSGGATDGTDAGVEHDSENDDVLAPLAAGGPYGGVGDVGSDHSDFFCSELAAAAYQAFSVLPPRRKAASYWPSDFASGGRVERELIGASLEPEIVLDCTVMEVRRASRMVEGRARRASAHSSFSSSDSPSHGHQRFRDAPGSS